MTARRMQDIQPFHVMALLARARELEAQGRSIVHMEIGEPDFPSPLPVIEAGQRALSEGKTHYTPALGLPQLRSALSGYYQTHYGEPVAERRIVITPGSSGALQLLMGVLVNPGDKVLLTDPGYPCNRNFVRFVDGEAVSLPVSPENGFVPTLNQIASQWTHDTRAIMLASPSNPTGVSLSPEYVKEVASFVVKRNGYLILDEIYHGLEYGESRLPTGANLENVFVVNSFSKFFGMTGWRIGWLVAPESFISDIDKLAQNIFLAASTPGQYAALASFTPETMDILEQRRQAFQQRRDYLVPELLRLGFEIPRQPDGAFYIYADCSRFTNDSYSFVLRLLEEAGVAVTPGKDFGSYKAASHIRFAYTTDIDDLKEGVRRLESFLKG